jgi:GTP-binding protein
MPEVAFAGRSNVGKSSLINCLVQRKNLVRTSRTPGQTQMINFFLINNALHFVDLPGYGYAKVPEKVRAQWGPMMRSYLTQRQSLAGIVHIFDLRHPPTPDDMNLWNWLVECEISAIPVLTKADKVPRGKWDAQVKQASQVLGISQEDFILFSAVTRQGREELLAKILGLLNKKGAEGKIDDEAPEL